MKLAGLLFLWILSSLAVPAQGHLRLVLRPAGEGLMTRMIQGAIDSCADGGGGVVEFLPGVYRSGTLVLRSHVGLSFERGVVLEGSASYADYRNDAFLYGEGLTDVSITGGAVIDGVDCVNPQGEEGFRGPHCIRLLRCSRFRLEGFTIRRSANWAFNCRYCSGFTLDSIGIRGGHDGLHTRFCDHFDVRNCDFRTGDDAFAGNDNRDFRVTGCSVNSSCNCFRLGCLNFIVRHCRLWGPGEYMHRIRQQRRYPTAFVHFSPTDDHPVLNSGNWLIEDVIMDSVDYVYFYNDADGLWQTGRPATRVRFNRVQVRGARAAFYIIGDTARQFNLAVDHSCFSFRGATEDKAVEKRYFDDVEILSDALLYARRYGKIRFSHVRFENCGDAPVMDGGDGGGPELRHFENKCLIDK